MLKLGVGWGSGGVVVEGFLQQGDNPRDFLLQVRAKFV